MIGGATTSKAHTAVKIEPQYEHGAIYVADASRAVGVASTLLSKEQKPKFLADLRDEYDVVRQQRAAKNEAKNNVPLAEAQANRTPIDWSAAPIVKPAKLGLTVLEDIDLNEITPLIDWTFFFHAWQLKGRFPKILDDAEKGEEARKLFADATAMLQKIIDEKWLSANAVVGLFAANAVGDDIEVYKDDSRKELLTTLHNLRKQGKQPEGKYNESLGDYIAPKDTGLNDYIGGFAATAGIGIDEKLAEFEADHDDYNGIMLKALADRLAEALTEWLHQKVRTEFWGYTSDEALSNEQLIEEI
jgi:5-methyltetrahydrofolate--homocysteine methyltransferase